MHHKWHKQWVWRRLAMKQNELKRLYDHYHKWPKIFDETRQSTRWWIEMSYWLIDDWLCTGRYCNSMFYANEEMYRSQGKVIPNLGEGTISPKKWHGQRGWLREWVTGRRGEHDPLQTVSTVAPLIWARLWVASQFRVPANSVSIPAQFAFEHDRLPQSDEWTLCVNSMFIWKVGERTSDLFTKMRRKSKSNLKKKVLLPLQILSFCFIFSQEGN